MAKTIMIVLPVLDDRLSLACLVSEISERFAGSDFTFHIGVVDDGSTESFAPADLILPIGSCVASVEIIRLAADLGRQQSISKGPRVTADGSKTDAVLGMAGDGQGHLPDIARVLDKSREHLRDFVLGGRTERHEPCAVMGYDGGAGADVAGVDWRSRQRYQLLRDPNRGGAAAGAGARAVKRPRGLDLPLVTCPRGGADEAQQLLGEDFADQFRISGHASTQRNFDGSLPIGAPENDEADPVCSQKTNARRQRRSGDFCLSIVIPCFNEEEVIFTTYHRVVDVIGSKDFRLQLIFVDDGSKDRTSEILTRIAAQDNRVTLVTLSRNFGHQAAVSAGLAHSHGNATAVIDADLQDPPEVILGMIEKWLQGYDVVYGVRIKRKEARWKKLCYSLFYRALHKIAFIDTPLDAGDFSLIDRQVLEKINQLPEKNRFFRGLRAWVGFAQVGIEYERAPRMAGVTKYPFLKLLKLAADGIFNFSTMPLKIVFYTGCLITFLSIIAPIMNVFVSKRNVGVFEIWPGDTQGAASIMVTILFIGGIQLICTGILGEYVGRIYHEVKGRPYFIARDHPSAASSASARSGGWEPRPDHTFRAGEAADSCRVKGQAS